MFSRMPHPCLCAFQQDIAFIPAYRYRYMALWFYSQTLKCPVSTSPPTAHKEQRRNKQVWRLARRAGDGRLRAAESGLTPLHPSQPPTPSNHPSTSSWNWTPPGVHRLCDTPTLLLSNKSFQKNSQRAAAYSASACRNSVYANEEKKRRRDLQPSLGSFCAPSVWVSLRRGNMNSHTESVGRVHWVEGTRRDTLIIRAWSCFLFLQTADLAVIVLNFCTAVHKWMF